MLTVAIHSAGSRTSVALFQAAKLLCEKTWKSRRDEAEKIMPELLKMLKKKGKNWKNLREVFVIGGPGPFTGLRVGVTIANTLAWTAQCPMKSATVFEYELARVPVAKRRSTAIIVRSGGDTVAARLPGAKKEKILSLTALPDYLAVSTTRYLAADIKPEDLVKLQKALRALSSAVKIFRQNELETFGNAAIHLMRSRRIKTVRMVKPLYLQKPHITKSKKETFAVEAQ